MVAMGKGLGSAAMLGWHIRFFRSVVFSGARRRWSDDGSHQCLDLARGCVQFQSWIFRNKNNAFREINNPPGCMGAGADGTNFLMGFWDFEERLAAADTGDGFQDWTPGCCYPTMKSKLTLLALFSAGVMQLNGQGKGENPNPVPNPAPSANENAWRKLVAENKQPEESDNKAFLDAGAAPEAQALKAAIMASSNVSKADFIILTRIRNATNDKADFETSVRALAASNKTGPGVGMAKAQIKFWESDETGWTPDMIVHQSKLSSMLASNSTSPEFKKQVWDFLKDKNVVGDVREARRFFKQYRKGLPAAEQIEATRKQKEAILATTDRNAALNAWLVELSADLVALELDQP